MAVLNIRNLPDEIHARLRLRAARAGRSMEAEARAILTAACLSDEAARPASELPAWVDRIYSNRKPRDVVKTLIAERRRESAEE
jgi:plasmid stability protein